MTEDSKKDKDKDKEEQKQSPYKKRKLNAKNTKNYNYFYKIEHEILPKCKQAKQKIELEKQEVLRLLQQKQNEAQSDPKAKQDVDFLKKCLAALPALQQDIQKGINTLNSILSSGIKKTYSVITDFARKPLPSERNKDKDKDQNKDKDNNKKNQQKKDKSQSTKTTKQSKKLSSNELNKLRGIGQQNTPKSRNNTPQTTLSLPLQKDQQTR